MLKVLSKEELTKEVAVIVGTRPGIIKFSPVIRALEEKKAPFFVIHTGQHYSFNMDRQFFEDLNLPGPRYTNEKVREEVLHGAQTAEMIRGIETALIDSKPRVVIVGGDANTNLAGALAARKLGLTLAHMEAGLRSHDWRMPEEHNRVMIDHISDILFAPTEQAKQNLIKDNVKGEMHLVGNTVVDAVYQNVEIAQAKSDILKKLDIENKKYFLVTIHREENVEHKDLLKKLLQNIEKIIEIHNVEIFFPVHPRTCKCLKQFGLWQFANSLNKLRMIDAVGYLDFLLLMKSAQIILTDSGGIQEEACILRVPCITLRDNTERPETVEVGANIVAGSDLKTITEGIEYFDKTVKDWHNPFGDGDSAVKIVEVLKAKICT